MEEADLADAEEGDPGPLPQRQRPVVLQQDHALCRHLPPQGNAGLLLLRIVFKAFSVFHMLSSSVADTAPGKPGLSG